ncbi:MAG: S8 family serine peptidase [Candidatus Heimdallarchaeota archaeon]|nr:S8 family serine peptidase [Candidatus Heimdallarchaeota archaeon]
MVSIQNSTNNGSFLVKGAEITFQHNQIDTAGAWELTYGSKDIIVAVIDSGIDFNHSQLEGVSWNNSDEIADNGLDDDSNGYVDDTHGWDFVSNDNEPGPETSDPIHWHATFISGLIAGKLDGLGMVGVAPNVTVMDIRVLAATNYAGTTLEGFGDAIRYAVDNGADVINLSLHNYSNSSYYYDDIIYAISQNVVIVSITGNTWVSDGGGREYLSFPGGLNEVISVGATSYTQEIADYSNYGEWTEIVAPVGDEGTGIRSTAPGEEYFYGWGTSFAAPQVAAAIALMKSLNNSLTVSEIRDILHKSATDLGDPGHDIYTGYGLLNVSKAVRAVLDPSVLLPPDDSSYQFLSIIPILAVITIIVIKKRKS